MCGFVAIFDPSLCKIPNAKSTVDKMCDQIVNRGPNYYGFHEEPGIAFGHRRLSIIDLSDLANQPMQKNGLVIVFNGEIYNYLEIRKDIESIHQINFNTSSDTEVLLEAYIHYGPDCVKKFNGMFSFIIWDSHKKSLFVCRDRLGVKPLYFAKHQGLFYFASDIKSIWEVISPSNGLSEKAVLGYFSYSYISTPESVSNNITKFPPAHFWQIKYGTESFQQYWNLNDVSKNSGFSFQEATQETSRLLDNAVKLRLRSDVPVGCFLSGGVDSSLVTAMAATAIDHPIHTYSIGFDNPEFDESQFAQRVSKKYNTEHYHVQLNSDCLEHLPQIVWHYSEPFGDASAVPTYFVSQKAKENLTVVLTGDGADEAFGGYVDAFAVYLNQKYQKVPAFLRKANGKLFSRTAQWHPLFRWAKKFNDLSEKKLEQIYLDLKGGSFLPYKTAFKNAQIDPDEFALKFLHDCKSMNPVDQLIHADIYDRLSHDFLVKVDRGTMAHSLEARSPFLDYRLMEWGYSLEHSIRYHHFKRKAVLKKVAEKFIDKDILYRKKMGFSIPQAQWLSEKKWISVIERLIKKQTILYDFFNKEIVHKIIDEFKQGNLTHANRIWLLLWFQIWEGIFVSRQYDASQKLSDLS